MRGLVLEHPRARGVSVRRHRVAHVVATGGCDHDRQPVRSRAVHAKVHQRGIGRIELNRERDCRRECKLLEEKKSCPGRQL